MGDLCTKIMFMELLNYARSDIALVTKSKLPYILGLYIVYVSILQES